MSSTQVIDPADVICGLKAAVTALECYHNMNLLRQQQERKQEKPKPPPMYMMIPIEEERNPKKPVPKKMPHDKHINGATLPTKKACRSAETSKPSDNKPERKTLSVTKFPEMRCGVLFARCNCMHRDGLQDSCPLSQCQGQSECLVKPWPECPPGVYLRSRHPELYSSPPNAPNITY